ncbi:MAG TPA: YceI family protein [Albitalea sp.]|nr:YceI family protein [Albitalea sp.]
MKTLLIAAAAAAATGSALAESASYAADPTHTFVMYEIGHFGTSTNRGRFNIKEGTVQFDRAAKTGKVDITIDINSVGTGVELLDQHIRSDEIFNAAKYPTGRFVADKFTFNGDKVSSVSGNLTLLGKTRPVTLKANNFNCYNNPMYKREVCGGDFEATVSRSQWGVNWGLEYGFPDNTRLLVQVEAIKQ